MRVKHNFVRLAEIQRIQQTSYNVGLDIHGFGNYEESLRVYGSVRPAHSSSEYQLYMRSQAMYEDLLRFSLIQQSELIGKMSVLLACIELYLMKIIDIYMAKGRIYSFKPQSAHYEQFGPAGMVLLARIRWYISDTAKRLGVKAITILDCKRGDIFETQSAYLNAYIGSLNDSWGVDYSPYNFEIMNVTPWMGQDVMVFYDKGKPATGLKLLKAGKCLIVVNKTSNPSGPRYQELVLQEREMTLQMLNVEDMYQLSQQEKLENRELSPIGLVVGSTHICDGSIREAFPTTTLLVPGFGAQGGGFDKIIMEMIRRGRWCGQGAIFSSSRGSMFPFLAKYGGSGSVANLESDALKALEAFRSAEKLAYCQRQVSQAGIEYPYNQ